VKYKRLLFLSFLLALALPSPALADGIIIPDPPICEIAPCPPPLPMTQLVIRYHRVTISIEDQVAVTHVDQVFYNPNDWTVEGTYVFPIPKDAVVSQFILWVDGEPVQAEILEAEEARRTYEDIVRKWQDPALLEYADQGAVRARIFPIPPQGERRVELEYTQALTAENDLVRYVYPLSTEKFSTQPLEQVSIHVEIRARVPIRAVYSPTHAVGISRESEFHVRAGYEASNVLPDADFALYYSLGESQAFHLLTYRDPSDPQDPDGFFLALLAPRPTLEAASIPKDVLLVLDRSGSMEGEKFLQAQDALRYILRHLNPKDRFNILAFSTGLERYATALRPASEASEAIPWVDRLHAEGSTDINRALLEAAALADPERPAYLIFLTDGLPTEGVTDSNQILSNFAASAPANLRLFAFGVGYDVDTFLLDSLAQENHGDSTYVLPGEALDETLSAFYAKISTPVLTDLSLDFGDLAVYDIYPEPLPDLFLGSQIVVVGRYRHGGTSDVLLKGKVNDEVQTFRYLSQVFSQDSRSESEILASLPRLWATRKIGHLLKQVRLHGPDEETVGQIVRLSIRYGIVTPYTSYLVTEPLPLGAEEQERIIAQEYNQMQVMATVAPASGQAAVQKAADQSTLAEAEAAPAPSGGAEGVVRILGARTFVYREGVWVDTAFDPQQMQTVKVTFLSEEYFSLARTHPELAAAFALGSSVIALSDGVAYEVVSAGEAGEPLSATPMLTPEFRATPSPTALPSRATPTVIPTVVPGSLPCAGGMLPLLVVVPAFWGASFLWRRRRANR